MRALAVVVVLVAGCGLPPLTSEEVFGLEARPRGWVYGVVSDASQGGPIAGATVQVEGYAAVSDSNGVFRVDGVGAGTVTVVASREGYAIYTQQLAIKPGANAVEVRLRRFACTACTGEDVCDGATGQCVQGASISGDVIDTCTRAALDAKVTIDGRSACSVRIKGFWVIRGLRPGGPQTLAAGKAGYQAYSTQVTLKAGFNALDPIELVPLGGCGATPPIVTECVCNTPGCQ